MVKSGWQLLSSFGNGTLLLPLLACAATMLARQSPACRNAARRWMMATAIAGLLVIGSKIAFYGWGTGVRAWNLTSASGHTTLALSIWPVLLSLLVPPARPQSRRVAFAGGVMLGLACGWSRVMLKAHPLSEVLLGAALGGSVSVLLLPTTHGLGLTLRRPSLAIVLLLAFGTWNLIHPINLPTERWLARSGAWLAGRDVPVSRKAWLRPPG